jgi:hypothetical protein
MKSRLELRKLAVHRQQLQGEKLKDLRFKDALRQSLDLMGLSFDMVEALDSRAGLIRIQNEVASVRNSRYARRPHRRSRTKSAKNH